MNKEKYIAPSREGTVTLTLHYSPEERKALRILAAQVEKSMNELVREGIAYVLEKYGK